MQQSDLLRNWIYTTFSENHKRRRREEGGERERERERQTETERQTEVQTSKLLTVLVRAIAIIKKKIFFLNN